MRQRCKAFIEWDGKKVALLSWTEDMDAWSFSLPAGREGSCPMMVARDERDICHGCYAMINRYNMPNVLNAQWRRFMWTKECLKTTLGTNHWHNTMIGAINSHVKNGFFRVHDSGDLFSPDYIHAWSIVCACLPHIRFWFPTRSWQAKNPIWIEAMKALAALPNVSLRPSAIRFDEAPPKIDWLSTGTGVVNQIRRGTRICPKTRKGGTCSSNHCRRCWDKTGEVNYLVHGWRGTHSIPNAISDKIQDTRKRIMLTVKGNLV